MLDELSAWFRSWAIAVNHQKSAVMVLTRRRNAPLINVHLDGTPLPQVTTHKHLGIIFNSRLSWSDHTSYVIGKASKKVGLLRRFRCRLPCLVLRSLYLSCVRPTLEYACGAWSGVGSQDALRLERTQRAAARVIAGASVKDKLSAELLLARDGLDPLARRRQVALVLPSTACLVLYPRGRSILSTRSVVGLKLCLLRIAGCSCGHPTLLLLVSLVQGQNSSETLLTTLLFPP